MHTFQRILIAFLSLSVLEHIAIQFDSDVKPSSVILSISSDIGDFTYMLGLYVAKICSFLIYLRLENFSISIWNLIISFSKLITSFFKWIPGYFETALTYVGKSYSIYLGSFILAMLIVYMVNVKTNFLKKFIHKYDLEESTLYLSCGLLVLMCCFVLPYLFIDRLPLF